MDIEGQELDSWDKVVEIIVNIKVKTLLRLPSGIWKISIKCFGGYKPAKKEDKDSKKNNSADTLFVDVFNRKQQSFAYQSQTNKKD